MCYYFGCVVWGCCVVFVGYLACGVDLMLRVSGVIVDECDCIRIVGVILFAFVVLLDFV